MSAESSNSEVNIDQKIDEILKSKKAFRNEFAYDLEKTSKSTQKMQKKSSGLDKLMLESMSSF